MSDVEDLKERFSTFSTYSGTPAEALELFDQARSRCPVPHSDQLGGFHLFLTYEDVRKGLLDWRTYSSGPSALRPYVEGTPKFPPNSYDPPEHSPWRQIFSDGVNTRSAERITPAVHADIIKFIEGFASRGECDLVADLAERVPMNAIFYILGLEESMHETVRHLTLKTLASVSDMEVFKENFIAFSAFGYEQVEKKRSNPAEDYLTILAEARMGDRPLTPDEIGACVISLLTAGHGTTVASMTNLFYEVLRNPQIKQQLLDDPSLIPVAVEENLRMHHPFFGLYRQATKDVTVNGSEIKAGETVYMCWQAGNRDPEAFPDPNSFRLDRNSNIHLSFGLGRHSCVGAATARMEMKLALEELLARLPDIELVDADSIAFEFHGAETSAIPALPARFTPH